MSLRDPRPGAECPAQAAARGRADFRLRAEESALLPAARPALPDLAARGLDHRWVLHVRSSQAFALNLFAPLDETGRRNVLGSLGHQVLRADPPEFEYSDDSDRPGESSQRNRHQTQVDVVLRGTEASGERVVALIEVKFTEIDFPWCSAYKNPANPARDVCQSPGLSGSQPDRCFQLANHGYRRRRYADYLSGVPVNVPSGSRSDGGCLVRRGLSQPMRNLALAHLLLAEAEADRVVYALCAPEGHPTIWRRLDEVRSAFPDTDRRTIRPMAAHVIASLQPRRRQCIPPALPGSRADTQPRPVTHDSLMAGMLPSEPALLRRLRCANGPAFSSHSP